MAGVSLAELQDAANRLRVNAIDQTNSANSGHPTSSVSAAELVATLFFAEMKYDVKDPRNVNADRFVLSKGHACPILYAAWHEAGFLSHSDLLTFRDIKSDLEGHPTRRLKFIDAATGSLGQGLSVAAGMAYTGKYIDKASYRVYCLLGDGETAEGAVWECAGFSSHYKLDNLVAIVDVNRLGQSQETQLGHDLEKYVARFAAFGWKAIPIDGHCIAEILEALALARATKDKPTVILAKTFKGRGIDGIEDRNEFHGKTIEPEIVELIRERCRRKTPFPWTIPKPICDAPTVDVTQGDYVLRPDYELGELVTTRQAYGQAIFKLAKKNKRIIVLDGDVNNSTFSYLVKDYIPDQFVQCFIAEQNMAGVALGMGCRDRTIPFVSTFGAFLGRAFDQIRMSCISLGNIKYVGSHCGVSVGEDGPSQMALEDLAAFRSIPNAIIIYPTDAVATERAVEMAAIYAGIVYIRTSRPPVEVLYRNDEEFRFAEAKVLKQDPADKFVLIGAGVTLYECLKAHKELASKGIKTAVIDVFFVKPIDVATIVEHAERVGRVIVVEDHYAEGGIGEAVATVLSTRVPGAVLYTLNVNDVPRSGKTADVLYHCGLTAKDIVYLVNII